jgi:hypothetical protein
VCPDPGPLQPGEGGIRRPGTVAVAGGNRRSCTPGFLFTDDGPGGAAVAVGRESQGQTESIRAPPVVEETEVRDVRRELVTIEVPTSAGCWTWQEPTGPRRDAQPRAHRESGVVPEETAPSGESQAA